MMKMNKFFINDLFKLFNTNWIFLRLSGETSDESFFVNFQKKLLCSSSSDNICVKCKLFHIVFFCMTCMQLHWLSWLIFAIKIVYSLFDIKHQWQKSIQLQKRHTKIASVCLKSFLLYKEEFHLLAIIPIQCREVKCLYYYQCN